MTDEDLFYQPGSIYNPIDRTKKKPAIRTEIMKFAMEMEKAMAVHDKGLGLLGENEGLDYTCGRLWTKMHKLHRRVESRDSTGIRRVTIDVANFAMMIFSLAE